MVDFDKQDAHGDRASTSDGRAPPDQLTISQGDDPDHELTVEACGELDGATASSMRSVLDAAVAAPARCVVVDLSAVEFMDCSSLRPLRFAARSLRAQGRDLVLRCPSVPVRRLLDITGTADELPLEAPAHTHAR
jgi:anti-anti-sigma factor